MAQDEDDPFFPMRIRSESSSRRERADYDRATSAEDIRLKEDIRRDPHLCNRARASTHGSQTMLREEEPTLSILGLQLDRPEERKRSVSANDIRVMPSLGLSVGEQRSSSRSRLSLHTDQSGPERTISADLERRMPRPALGTQHRPPKNASSASGTRSVFGAAFGTHGAIMSTELENSCARNLSPGVQEVHKFLRDLLPDLEERARLGMADPHVNMCCRSALLQLQHLCLSIEASALPGISAPSPAQYVPLPSKPGLPSKTLGAKPIEFSRTDLTYDFVFSGPMDVGLEPKDGPSSTIVGLSNGDSTPHTAKKRPLVRRLSLSDKWPDVGSKRKSFQGDRYELGTGEKTDSANLVFIHPEKPFRLTWDFSAFFLIVVLSFIVPLELAFFWDAAQPILMVGFGYMVDVFFILDIFLNFFTAFYEGHSNFGILRTDLKVISKNYAKGWFIIDLPATIPFFFEVIEKLFLAEGGTGSEDSMLLFRLFRYAKVARVAKMLRVVKLGGLMQAIEEKLVAAQSMTVAFQLLKMTIVMLLFAHWLACVWFFMGYQHELQYPYEPSWLSAAGFVDSDGLTQYIAAFYFAITTGTTVGYGDICPTNSWERFVTAFMLLLSVAYIGQFLGRVSTMVSSLRAKETQMAAAKRDALLFMLQRNVEKDLQFKVLRYIENTYEFDAVTSMDRKIMETLSNSLQNELALAITGTVFKGFPLFQDFDLQFLQALCKVGRTIRAGLGDTVVAEEQAAHEMYWVVKGEVAVSRRGRLIHTLKEGDWFGELALFFPGAIRTATVKCERLSEFLVLHHDDFHYQMQEYPNVKFEYNKLAKDLKKGDPRGLKLECKRCGATTHLTRDCPIERLEDEDAPTRHISRGNTDTATL